MNSFVYEGTEVVRTGRTATRKMPRSLADQELVEIEPVDKTFTWKKWVSPSQLFTVNEDPKGDNYA